MTLIEKVGLPYNIGGHSVERLLCKCGRFTIPVCCGMVFEDIAGDLRHTPTVCYDIRTMEPIQEYEMDGGGIGEGPL